MKKNISPYITRQEGLALIEQYFKSGLRPKAFCMQKRLSRHVFYYWQKVYKKRQGLKPNPAAFLPLKIVSPTASALEVQVTQTSRIYFKPNITIEVPSGFDKITLQNILEACQQCG